MGRQSLVPTLLIVVPVRFELTWPNLNLQMGTGLVRFFLKKGYLACLVFFLPTFLLAANSAMLTVSEADALPNTENALRSSALFIGDTVATKPDSVASINAEGSMILVLANSSVQFEGNSVNMGHGGVVVTTSQAMAVRAGKLTIAPVAQASAKFEVSDSHGVVQIAAREGALAINDGASTTILQEGQETTRQDSDQGGGQKTGKGAPPTSNGFHISKKTAVIIIGSAAAAGTTAAILLSTGNGSHPVSPAVP
jgi:hypothetical protein